MTIQMQYRAGIAFVLMLASAGGCSSDANPHPAGSCQASPTAATGSSNASCIECAKSHCDAELTQSSGSGWASQYIGGDGACVAYDACACKCYGTSADANALIACAANCGAQLDASCQAAMTATTQCIDAQCSNECR